jgi:hypothetical protein
MSRTATRISRRAATSRTFDLAAFIQGLAKALFDPYRPEQHYMRGPGPKWHAKHDRSPLPALPAMRRVPVPVRVRVRVKI